VGRDKSLNLYCERVNGAPSDGANGMKTRVLTILLLLTLTVSAFAQAKLDPDREKRLGWWREARFGMMVHWGLYALPAGQWKGQAIPGIGEWIMNRAKIPVKEYEQLAKRFNPVQFDADAWVAVAKNAGMKYIVITSKHHDGFAMYGSKASPYNIVDATPFKRDPMKELAAACQRAGIKLGFYYSQTQDWHEYDAVGNTWDWPEPDAKKDFSKYFEAKCKPQVKEILTGYGPLAEIWFDTPRNISKEMSLELVDMVRKLNPQCLVDGRVGNGVGDYESAGDNQISATNMKRDWETPVTLNDTWGFKRDDNNWKSSTVLVRQLVQVAGRNGNYLLNVGPTAEGIIPAPSVERLAEVGQWMKVNGDSIYGTKGSPFEYDFPWGAITTKADPNRVYLHIFEWPADGAFSIVGIKTKIKKAYLLAEPSKPLFMRQDNIAKTDHYSLTLRLPKSAPDDKDTVVALDIDPETPLDVLPGVLQQPDGSVTLPANLGGIHTDSGKAPTLQIDSRGVAMHWTKAGEWMNWEFRSNQGRFNVIVITSQTKDGKDWEGGHQVSVNVDGKEIKGAVTDDGHVQNPSNPYWPYVESKIGTIDLGPAVLHQLALKAEKLEGGKGLGLTLVSVKLVPTGR
jgi:alpha-L-fucosidase